MMQVVWSVDTLDDLDGIVRHIAAENPQAALNVIGRIESTVSALGHMATGRPGRVSGTYEKVIAGLPHIINWGFDKVADVLGGSIVRPLVEREL